MQFFTTMLALPALALAASSGIMPSSNGTAIATVTTVVESFTTSCPEATVLTFAGQEYTATAATVLTITNCPCTIATTVPVKTGAVITPTMSAMASPTYVTSGAVAEQGASFAALAVVLAVCSLVI